MDFNSDRTSIDHLENRTNIQLSQADSTATSQYSFRDIIPESTTASENSFLHDQGVTTPSTFKPTTADAIEIFRRTLAGNWCMLLSVLVFPEQ